MNSHTKTSNIDAPWAEKELRNNPVHFSHIRHNYRLTPPNLSAATHFVLPTDFRQQIQAEDEQLYLQSNLPYLILLAIVFVINGLILFFGQDIKTMIRAGEQNSVAETSRAKAEGINAFSGSAWDSYHQQPVWFMPEDNGAVATERKKEQKDTPTEKTHLFQ